MATTFSFEDAVAPAKNSFSFEDAATPAPVSREEKQSNLRAQQQVLRNTDPTTALSQLPSALFTPSDATVERANQEVATKQWPTIDALGSDATFIKPTTHEDVSTLAGVNPTSRTAKVTSGAVNAAGSVANSFTTPENALAFASPAAAGAFIAQMATQIPGQLSRAAGAYSGGDTSKGDEELLNGLVAAGMIAVPAAHLKAKNPLESALGSDNAKALRDELKNFNKQIETAPLADAPQVQIQGALPAETPASTIQPVANATPSNIAETPSNVRVLKQRFDESGNPVSAPISPVAETTNPAEISSKLVDRQLATSDALTPETPSNASEVTTPKPDWQVTVQSPIKVGENTAPGFVQFDDVTGGENKWSKSAATLAKEGVQVPDFSQLPQGKYTFEQAQKLLSEQPNLKESQQPLNPMPEIKGSSNRPETDVIPAPDNVTSIKNDQVDIEREKRGLPPVVEPAKRGFGKVWDDALQQVAQNPDVQTRLIDELRENPRALTDTEDALLLQRQITLHNEYQKIQDKIKDATPEDAAELKIREAKLSDDLLDLYNINKTSGTETGRGLNARKIMANEDYSLSRMETRLRSAKRGDNKLSDSEKTDIKKIAKNIEKTRKAMEGYDESIAKDSTAPKYSDYVIGIAEKIVSALDKRADAARQRIKEKSGRLSAGIDPTLLADYAEIGASHIAHIGLDFAKWSKAMTDEFGDKIAPQLKAIFDDAQKRADELSAKLAPQNPEVKRAVKKQPAGNTALKSLKTRYANRTAELKGKIESGDLTVKPRNKVALDKEALKLKEAYENAKLEFDKLLVKERLKNRTLLEKTQDTFVKWRRAFLLSSPITLAKLTSAAIERLAFTPIEEGLGAVYSKLPVVRGVAAKAPREGGLNAKAEAKALTEGFTQGMKDAWQTLKTGKGQLDSLFGKRDVLPHSAIDFIGAIHGALKAPVKRAEFARSFEKRAEFAIKNGQDVSDPLVQTQMAVGAYKDANRAIFMQDNKLTAGWQALLRILESPNKDTGKVNPYGKAGATALKTFLPIVKVPTNIVAETMQYALGSVTGSVRLGVAVAKGLENLKPAEADIILRELKKGSLGAALLLAGFFNPQSVGGYYQRNDKDQKGHPKFGTIKIGDWNVPTYLIHNPLLEQLQIGATIRHVADSKLRKKDKETQGVGSGVLAAAIGLTEEVPFVGQVGDLLGSLTDPYERREYINRFVRDMTVPLGVSWAAKYFDKDANGNYIERDAKTTMEAIQSAVPLMREKLPVKKKKRA